jgi:hypothetical protein
MAARKPTKPTELPTRTKIPGGEATWWKPEELPTVKEREISILSMTINQVKMKALVSAREIKFDDGETVTAEQLQNAELAVLTQEEARALLRLTDVSIWAYLKSWTLTEIVKSTDAEGNEVATRRPIPLPETADDVVYLPKNIYKALEEHANQIVARSSAITESFGPTVQDDDSPTGD